MPPENYKIDFAAQTAAFYTTFPQPESSQRIVARNHRNLVAIAEHVADTIATTAREKSRQALLPHTTFHRIA